MNDGKTCSKCRQPKPLDAFGKDSSRRDRVSPWCKQCTAESAKRYRATAAGKANMQRLTRDWRRANPDKARAAKERALAKKRAADPDYAQRHYAANKVALLAKNKAWVESQGPGYRRGRHLLRRYGLTLEAWEAMFVAQNRACAICLTSDPGPRGQWTTDHCHQSGRTRGILCNACNTAVGNLREDPGHAAALLRYIVERCSPLKSPP